MSRTQSAESLVEFREVYGDVYRKLHAAENEGGDNEYRVK